MSILTSENAIRTGELYAALTHHLPELQAILAAVHLFAAEADLAENLYLRYFALPRTAV